MHNRSLSWLSIGTSMKSGGGKLDLWTQTSPFNENKCGPARVFHMWVRYPSSQITAEQRSFFNKNKNNKKKRTLYWTLYISIHLIFVMQTNQNMHSLRFYHFKVRVMTFNATFSTISVILLWLVSWAEESWVPGENHRLVTCHWQTI